MIFVQCRFLDPIIYGKYPEEMKRILGSTLPEFSSNDMEKLKKGLDFIGINHYTSYYVQDCIYSMCGTGKGVTKTEGFYQQSSIGESVCNLNSSPAYWLTDFPFHKSVAEAFWLCRLNLIGKMFTHMEWKRP